MRHVECRARPRRRVPSLPVGAGLRPLGTPTGGRSGCTRDASVRVERRCREFSRRSPERRAVAGGAQSSGFQPGEDEVSQWFPALGPLVIHQGIGEFPCAVEDPRPRCSAMVDFLGRHRSIVSESARAPRDAPRARRSCTGSGVGKHAGKFPAVRGSFEPSRAVTNATQRIPCRQARKAHDSRDSPTRSGDRIEPSNRRATTACRF